MKLIATLKLGNFPLKIYEESTLRIGDERVYGYCTRIKEFSEIMIVLDPLSPKAIYWETFWHEMGHAFEYAFGFDLPHPVINQIGIAVAAMMGSLKWKSKPAHNWPVNQPKGR